MLALVLTVFSWLACRFRSRAELELELIALHHQVAVLHRQQRGHLRLCAIDRLMWVCLYRVWPRCLKIMVLVKPATLVGYHGSPHCSALTLAEPIGLSHLPESIE